MKRSKAANIIMNILITVFAVFCFFTFIYMIGSFDYVKEQAEKESESTAGSVDYDLSHGEYDRVLYTYYVKRLYETSAPQGYEDNYNISQYCHYTFMSKIYMAEDNDDKIKLADEKLKEAKEKLGSYSYTADEIDAIILGN